MIKKYKKIFIAGTFDGLHVGHQYLLWQGSNMSDELVVIVARDRTVKKIKKRYPVYNEEDRLKAVKAQNFPNAQIRLGRSDGNFHKTIQEESPDLLLLGYDQRFDARVGNIQTLRLKAYFPEFFKSSKFMKMR